jgi:8-oxo-dGTP diphosphatase
VTGPPPLPAIPVSAGALIFDRRGRLLILKPTYKSGWTIPGGVMEADGETPWDACRREVREECGIEVTSGRLAAMDFRRPRQAQPAHQEQAEHQEQPEQQEQPGRPARAGGVRFLFDCGQFPDADLAAIVVQPEEVSEYRLAPLAEALALLRGPIRRRVKAATSASATVYLEDGRPVGHVARLLRLAVFAEERSAGAAAPRW